MADFTLNAPGTTNNPWNPPNMAKPVGNIKSDATGWRAQTNGVVSAFGNNLPYNPALITSTGTIAATLASDDLFVGDLVLVGPNAGSMIGVYITATNVAAGTINSAGSLTIGATTATTRTVADIYAVTVAIVTGTATITLTKNGSPITLSANTTTTFTSEPSLVAGHLFYPFNSNGTYLSQFTGNGFANYWTWGLTA